MTERFHTIEAKGVRLTLDTAVGHVRRFEVERDGRKIKPLHVAPWVDDPSVANSSDPNILPNLKFLAGDFFCAPFSKSDVEAGTPGHGWPGNSEWKLLGETRLGDGVTARYELVKKVMGATLVKEITLRDGHPFAYQSHIFTGGAGAVSAASHAMTQFSKEGHLSFSPKQFGELPATQQESDPARGRSLFATDKRFTDLRKLPLADGTTVDIHHYPVASRHEDFVMLVEAVDSPLGWAAASRPAEGDIMLSLKNPADFPVTFLWFSNGGRYYEPWNRRHLGVLGIEEGRALGAAGHAASIAPNPLSEAGIPTSITLGPNTRVELRHVIGGVPLPAGWTSIFSVDAADGALKLTGDTGASVTVPFDLGFVKR